MSAPSEASQLLIAEKLGVTSPDHERKCSDKKTKTGRQTVGNFLSDLEKMSKTNKSLRETSERQLSSLLQTHHLRWNQQLGFTLHINDAPSRETFGFSLLLRIPLAFFSSEWALRNSFRAAITFLKAGLMFPPKKVFFPFFIIF